MANITYPDKIVGSQYLNTEANQVKEVVNTNASRLTTVEGVAPTSNQKAALAGTHGSPSGSNRYVTDGDPRLGALSNPKAIFFPVDDLAELKAIDTTEAEQAPDKWLIFVKDLGVYYLDRTSTETPDDSFVVEPTAGPGRWIRETRRGDGGSGGPAIAAIYDDIADMIAAQGAQEAQAFYRVNDSTAAGLTGYSTWEYLGTTNELISDYRLESAEERLSEWTDTTKGVVQRAIQAEAESSADGVEGDRDNDKGLTARGHRWAHDANRYKVVTFNTTLTFEQDKIMILQPQTGAIAFTYDSTGNKNDTTVMVSIQSNGINVPTFSSDFEPQGYVAYLNTINKWNHFLFKKSPSGKVNYWHWYES
jgi:hypothetical protein